jgi:uncharacterized iron-regulated protein
MRHFLFAVFAALLSFSAQAQNFSAYQLYNTKGKAISFEKALKKMSASQVILFGELHNNPIDHWLQYEISLYFSGLGDSLVLGAEMLETDNAEVYNQYLAAEIDFEALDTLARLWPNFKTDYKPLLDLARDSSIPFIATNIPRRYARIVYRGGFESLDTLTDEEKAWIAPLPIAYNPELPGYLAMLEMAGGHGGENLPKAQAAKDATMAYFIFNHLPEVGSFIHFNGDYHSANFEGICWYLQQLNPEISISTISTVLQEDVSKLEDENKGRADYILVIDTDMTTTY